MKTILFDLTVAQPLGSKFHGAGAYTESVFLALCKKADQVNLICIYNSCKYLNPLIKENCERFNLKMQDVKGTSFYYIVKKISPDVYFTALPSEDRIVHVENVRLITVCHDIRNIDCHFDPFYYKFAQNWKDWVFIFDSIFLRGMIARKNTLSNLNMFIGQKNTDFITVSRHTKYHVLSLFPYLNQKKIPVFYSPMHHKNKPKITKDDCLPESIIKNKYFLMDSGWRWMKNNLRAAIAIDQVFSENQNLDFKVVITGIKSSKPYLSKLKNKNKFIFLDYVDDFIMNNLHENAYCFVYPSLAEGFGYSPLKSMMYEVPVIASSISSIPEVCGDAVLYTNPKSITEIKNRVLQILNPKIYKEIKIKCLKRYNDIAQKQKNDLKEFINYLVSNNDNSHLNK